MDILLSFGFLVVLGIAAIRDAVLLKVEDWLVILFWAVWLLAGTPNPFVLGASFCAAWAFALVAKRYSLGYVGWADICAFPPFFALILPGIPVKVVVVSFCLYLSLNSVLLPKKRFPLFPFFFGAFLGYLVSLLLG